MRQPDPAGRDLARNERARRHLPATAVQKHDPEGRDSTREWDLMESVCRSRLCASVTTV